MVESYRNAIAKIAQVYPLRTVAEEQNGVYPRIAEPIDVGARKLLAPLTGGPLPTSLNPLEVERGLEGLGTRLATCMTYREKAQELELRLVTEAIDYGAQKQVLSIAQELEDTFAEAEPKLLRNYTSLKLESPSITGDARATKDYWSSQATKRREQFGYLLASLETRLKRAKEPGNGGNSAERFEFLKALFDLNLKEAYLRARTASHGLKLVYGIDMPLDEVTEVGYLNQLVLWAQRASDALDLTLDKRQQGVVAVAVSSHTETTDGTHLLPYSKFTKMRDAGVVVAALTAAPFDDLNMRNPRLRGLQVRLHRNYDKKATAAIAWSGDFITWPMEIKLPEQHVEADRSVRPVVALAAHFQTREEAGAIQGGRSLHNASPIGEWTIRIAPSDLSGVYGLPKHRAVLMTNLFLFMRVSYER